MNPTSKVPILETEKPTNQDIPDDTILLVRSSLDEETGDLDGNQETQDQDNLQPTVSIKCLR